MRDERTLMDAEELVVGDCVACLSERFASSQLSPRICCERARNSEDVCDLYM